MNILSKETIVYVAGCSGGHIFPALTLAHTDHYQNQKRIIFVTTNRPFDQRVVLQHAWLTKKTSVMAPYYGVKKFGSFLYCMLTCVIDVCKSIYLLRKEKVTKVVSTGGYIALPIAFASRLLGVPVEVYELNVEPGKAVLLLAKMGCTINMCFPQTRLYLPVKTKTAEVLYPLRFSSKDILSKKDARLHFGIDYNKKVMFIVGGSQGSRFFNTCMQEVLSSLTISCASLYIIHQTGIEDVEAVRAYYADKKIEALVLPFFDHVHYCYQAADVVVSRAGAGVLAELAFFGCRSAIIPLETVQTSHQKDNAYAYATLYPLAINVFEQGVLAKDNSKLVEWLNNSLM